jgi:iron complex transport system ATP-binding protein
VNALAIHEVSVELGGRRVLEQISADVSHGDWVTLIGPNGAGKSTLLRAMAGLVPFAGTIELDGVALPELSRREVAQRLAFVPQSPSLPPEMRVREYVLLGRTPHIGAFGHESVRDLEATERALERLDLLEFRERPLRTLSGGEQQRAVLARALAQEAPLLLLDEPTTSLDIGRQQQVLELVADLREHGDLTVISAMHELTLATQYGDRLLLLSDGKLVASGRPEEIATEALISTHYRADVRVISEAGAPVAVIPMRRNHGA